MAKRLSRTFSVLGVLCILSAVLLIYHNTHESQTAAENSQTLVRQLQLELPAQAPTASSPAIAETEPSITPDFLLSPDAEMPITDAAGWPCIGILQIPILELQLPIISEYMEGALYFAPICSDGSIYAGNAVFCGHNYPYHFGRLDKLLPGDELIFTDVQGNVFRYQVTELETIPGDGVAQMLAGDSQWDLTLYTCTVGGQNRVTIRSVLVSSTPAPQQ